MACLGALLLVACEGSEGTLENAGGTAGQSGEGGSAGATQGFEVLHQGEDGPHSIAFDDRFLYWVAGASLRRAPLDGGAPVTLAELDDLSGVVPAGDDDLYIISRTSIGPGGSVGRMSRDGGAPDWVVPAPGLQDLVVGGGHLYWLGWTDTSLWRLQSDGSGLTELVTDLGTPRFLALAEEQLYFADGGGLYRLSAAGGTPALVTSTVVGTNPVWRGGSLYWLAGDPRASEVMVLPPTGPAQPVIEMLMDSPGNGVALRADAEALYWQAGSRLLRLPLATRVLENVASGLDVSSGTAVAEDWIYVAEYTEGRVLRLAKDGSAYRPSSQPITGPCPQPVVSAEDRALTPRAEPNLELLAFELEPDRPVASQATYDRLVGDVGAIRALEPALVEVTYLQPDDGRRLQLQWTSTAALAFEEGRYSAWDCLNEAYGLQDFSFHEPWVDVVLAGTYNLSVVNEGYRQLPGVISVSGDLRSLDGPTICVSRDGDRYEYVFDDTGGNCPETCWEHRAYHFASGASGQVTELARWDSTTGAAIPEWFGAICKFQPRVEL